MYSGDGWGVNDPHSLPHHHYMPDFVLNPTATITWMGGWRSPDPLGRGVGPHLFTPHEGCLNDASRLLFIWLHQMSPPAVNVATSRSVSLCSAEDLIRTQQYTVVGVLSADRAQYIQCNRDSILPISSKKYIFLIVFSNILSKSTTNHCFDIQFGKEKSESYCSLSV